MKSIYKFLCAGLLSGALFASCSTDQLETVPTTSVSGTSLFSDANSALIPLNGIYRAMYTSGLSTTGNTHQCFGITAYSLAADCMGDDFIQAAQGSGWFWFDTNYNVKARYTSSAWRSYDLWFAYYQWIANANYIIAAENEMGGAKAEVNYVVGQAYAIRAYSYFMLSQWFARTYVGHESEPCVPIYTKPTSAGTEGQPRATVKEFYDVIDSDINKACEMLAGQSGTSKSHIGYDVALGIKARICLTEGKWAEAAQAAEEAISVSKAKIVTVENFNGVNSVNSSNVMWGAEIISDQAGMYASFFTHMCTDIGYGQTSPKQINRELYAKMNESDARRAWWSTTSSFNKDGDGNDLGYQQTKFKWADLQTWLGDYVWMRIEEMYLTAAEAELRSNNVEKARKYLGDFMAYRDNKYDVSLKSGTALGKLTYEWTGSLLEEILIQRRIELWGEYGRVYDIRRLKQGFKRTREQGFPTAALLNNRPTDDPENYMWVLTIPQAEFDGNINMDAEKDQNPAGDK